MITIISVIIGLLAISLIVLSTFLKNVADKADNENEQCSKNTFVLSNSIMGVGIAILIMSIVVVFLTNKKKTSLFNFGGGWGSSKR